MLCRRVSVIPSTLQNHNSQDNSTTALAAAAMQRSVSGVLSALLSFKRRPSQIRYQAASPAARQVNTMHT
jgi:hypothetical protein